jgi:hypothetical protein
MQAAPPAPHAGGSVPLEHMPLPQHPEHELESQVQAPPAQ